jgi:hypothetical protein
MTLTQNKKSYCVILLNVLTRDMQKSVLITLFLTIQIHV